MPTRVRNLRVDDETWDATKTYAAECGTTVTTLLVNYMRSLKDSGPEVAGVTTRRETPRGSAGELPPRKAAHRSSRDSSSGAPTPKAVMTKAGSLHRDEVTPIQKQGKK
jgi:hypothetical protein